MGFEGDSSEEMYYPPVFVIVSGSIDRKPSGDEAKSFVLVNLNQLTRIEVFPPKPAKMDFPEVQTSIARPKNTPWKCVLFSSDGDVRTLRGEEASAFCNWLLELGIRRFDNLETKPPE